VTLMCGDQRMDGPESEFPMNTEATDLHSYRERLKSGDENARIEIYREIGELRFQSDFHLLIEGLADPSPRVTSVVSEILTEIDGSNVTGLLLESLRNQDPGIRFRAMDILAELGSAALPQVTTYLSDGDPDVRIASAVILGNSRLKESFSALKGVMKDPEENIRYAAAEALGKIGESKAIPFLIDALNDPWVRYAAVESLGMLNAKEAVPHLLRVYGEDEWVRLAVIEALGDIGDPWQIDFIIGEMSGNSEMILHACLNALAKIEQRKPSGAFDRLKNTGLDVDSIIASGLAMHDPEVKKLAIWTLGFIG